MVSPLMRVSDRDHQAEEECVVSCAFSLGDRFYMLC